MFCDLVGSTRISAQLEAEEWRDLVSAYLNVASVAVTEMGGHVAKKLGDGLMALFGGPLCRERTAESAWARYCAEGRHTVTTKQCRRIATVEPSQLSQVTL